MPPHLPYRALAHAAAAVLALAAGCKASRSAVDICGRGDTDALAAALDGGSLRLRFLDGAGAELLLVTAAADEPSALPVELPDGTARVEVVGLDEGGTAVASGTGDVDGGRACVCFALDEYAAAACAGVACEVASDACSFHDAVTGAPSVTRTIVLGDNDSDGAAGGAADTSLSSADGERDLNFGGAPSLVVTSDPVRTALVRFALDALPPGIALERAELELQPCDGCAAAGSIAVFPVVEAWAEGAGDAGGDPACASWNCRTDGVAWAVAGCGYLSDVNRSRAGEAMAQHVIDTAGAPLSFDVTAAVAGWLADPTTNHGVAIAVDEQGSVELGARQGPDGARPRLRVTFRFEPPPAEPDAGPLDPPDAGADTDAGPVDDMVAVPAGAFLMGCDPAVIEDCPADQLPLHAVTLSAFEIDRTEVTQEAYAVCVDAGACPVPACEWDPAARPRYPVTCVTWPQARDYCAFAGKRLPTEAEWEKAARGTSGGLYPWGNDEPTCARANAFGCVGAPQPVGIHPDGASPYGAQDLAGNIAEYVADYYAADYYATSPTMDPTGPATGTKRVRRGGGFGGSAAWITTFVRVSVGNGAAKPHIGFRCAR